MIYFTELQNLPTYDVKSEYLGRLFDLGVDASQDPLRVASYLVKTLKDKTLCISHEQVQSISVRAAQTNVTAEHIRCYPVDEGILRVKKDILDQQIIDVNDRKVVRVNDVDFDIQPTDGHTGLRIVAVNVGLAAAVRRLLQGAMTKRAIRKLTAPLPSKTIPWEFVNLIESDPARRVKLRISYARLAKLHPADMADILEELSHNEQKAVIESLDDETAARAISEIPTRMQVALLESIAPEKASDIVEEMPPDEAADILQKLPPETSAGLIGGMEKEEAQEVQELLRFKENTAGSLMTSEFVMVGETATVQGVRTALKHFEGPLESIHVIYTVDHNAALTGAIPLARILAASTRAHLKELITEPLISVEAKADGKTVIDLFHKYNLPSLPVVDKNGHLLGVVTADDVIEIVLHRT
jgi:magnesium transporter